MTELSAEVVLAALTQRLAAAAAALGLDLEPSAADAGSVLAALLERVARTRDLAEAWLLIVALNAALPTRNEVLRFVREFETHDVQLAGSRMLARAIPAASAARVDLPLEIRTGGVVIEVDYCARHELHTGIQRVVRETMPRWWAAGRDHLAVRWTDHLTGLISLDDAERDLVYAHGDRTGGIPPSAQRCLVVPWLGTLVLPDVPATRQSPRLVALAECSGNQVTTVGYDMIPVVSAELRPPGEGTGFADFLAVVRHAHLVAGISASAAEEYAGFAEAVRAQGLPGPEVVEVPLPSEVPPPSPGSATPAASSRVRVLCIGNREPHKNHRAVLQAAEVLWRRGLDFEVALVGGRGWSTAALDEFLTTLARAGRPVEQLGRVSDQELWAQYRRADVSVFLSLHEGYGLPAAESLAVGTPVLTSDFGSLREIAAGGGALTVDPRDDAAITEALQRVITEEPLRRRLREAAVRRPRRTWDDYAAELWPTLTSAKGLGRDAGMVCA